MKIFFGIVGIFTVIVCILTGILLIKQLQEEKAKKEAQKMAAAKQLETERMEQEKAKQKKEEEQRIREFYGQFLEKSRVIKAADTLSRKILLRYEKLDRNLQIENLECETFIHAKCLLKNQNVCNRIKFDIPGLKLSANDSEQNATESDRDASSEKDCVLIDFQMENLQPLHSKEEMYALVRAIAALTVEKIKEIYKKDASGTAYTLQIKEEAGYLEKNNFYGPNIILGHKIQICLLYTAKNGNHIPLQPW